MPLGQRVWEMGGQTSTNPRECGGRECNGRKGFGEKDEISYVKILKGFKQNKNWEDPLNLVTECSLAIGRKQCQWIGWGSHQSQD